MAADACVVAVDADAAGVQSVSNLVAVVAHVVFMWPHGYVQTVVFRVAPSIGGGVQVSHVLECIVKLYTVIG